MKENDEDGAKRKLFLWLSITELQYILLWRCDLNHLTLEILIHTWIPYFIYFSVYLDNWQLSVQWI